MLRTLGVVAFAAAALSACAPGQAELTGEALVARGDYLVNGVVLCGDCHTPRLPTGALDEARSLQGAPNMTISTVEMPWGPFALQLAGIPANYTEEQFIAFLQTGVRPDGSPPRPPMPPYRLNDADARAVAAYIATLPRAEE